MALFRNTRRGVRDSSFVSILDGSFRCFHEVAPSATVLQVRPAAPGDNQHQEVEEETGRTPGLPPAAGGGSRVCHGQLPENVRGTCGIYAALQPGMDRPRCLFPCPTTLGPALPALRLIRKPPGASAVNRRIASAPFHGEARGH